MAVLKALDTVYLHVTKACNLHCAYCYFGAGVPMQDELSTGELVAVLEDVRSLNPRRAVFTGGEPLLREDILQLAASSKPRGGVELCLTTNGTLVGADNAAAMVEGFDEVRISIDGPVGPNDSLRGRGTHQKAMAAFQHVLNAGGDPVAFITVTSLNLAHLKEFMRSLLARGITRIHLAPLRLVGRATDESLLCEWEDAKRAVDEFWQERFGLTLTGESRESFNCGVGKFLTVHPDGSVFPCHVLAFPEFRIGNVRERRLSDIYRDSRLMRRLRRLRFGDIPHCSECFGESHPRERCLGVPAQDSTFRKRLLHLLSRRKS